MNNISDSSQVIDVSHSQVDRLQSEIDFPGEEMKVKKKQKQPEITYEISAIQQTQIWI